MISYVLILCFISKIVVLVKGQSAECRTPNNQNGICIPIQSCPSLYQLLQKDTLFPQERYFLQQSQCSSKHQAYACCPDTKNKGTLLPEPGVYGIDSSSDRIINGQIARESAAGYATCRTPNNQNGICIPIQSCPSLYQLLRKDPIFPKERNFLLRSQCSSEQQAYVCCPDIKNEGPLLPEPGVCGVDSNSDRIINGQITAFDEFPWMALVDYSKPRNGRGFHCGGVLINNRYVLTAAHCVKAEAIREKRWRISSVRLGEWDTNSERDCKGETEEERKESNNCADPPLNIAVEETIVNENYDPKSNAHDIALLRLSVSVNYTDFIKPICLPKSESFRSLDYEGINLEVAGWGKTEHADFSNFKLKVNVDGWSLERCNKAYNQFGVNLGSGQICAGGINGTDSCNGDSGGPLMALDESNLTLPYYYLAGVVSFGPKKCGTEGIPGVYTRVSAYSDWILQNIRA